MAHEADPLRLEAMPAQGAEDVAQALRPVHQRKASARGQQPCRCGAELFQTEAEFRSRNGGFFADLSAPNREIGWIGDHAVKAPGGERRLTHVALQHAQAILQAVEGDVLLRQRAGLLPQLQPCHRAVCVAGAQQQTQRTAARAEIGDARPRRQSQKLRQQDGVRPETKASLRLKHPNSVPKLLTHCILRALETAGLPKQTGRFFQPITAVRSLRPGKQKRRCRNRHTGLRR